MTHEHGSEYQIKIVYDDGTEELSGWIASQIELSQLIAALPQTAGKVFWLRERSAFCPYCCQEQRVVVECPIVGVPCLRYRPHDSHYLVAVGVKNRCEVFGVSFGNYLGSEGANTEGSWSE